MPPRRSNSPRLQFAARISAMSSLATESFLADIGHDATGRIFESKEDLERSIAAQLEADVARLPTEPRARARACLAGTVGAHVGRSVRAVLVDEALHLDPGNADALRLVADRIDDPTKRLGALEKAIAAGLDRIGGEAAVLGERGRAWGTVAMRPYLRARGRRVETLLELGRVDDAIADGEALLAFDERDAMGMRRRLAALYLMAGKPGAFRRLARTFDEDDADVFAWGHVLASLLDDDTTGAGATRSRAAASAPHVACVLLEPWTAPNTPELYEPGAYSEQLLAAHALYPAFCAHPTALAWLLAATPSVKPRSRRMRNLLASFRPGVDQDAEPRWLEWLLRARDVVPEALQVAVRLDGDRAIPWVVSLLERDDLDRTGAVGSGFGPTSAAHLLGALAHPAALPALARGLAHREDDGSLSSALSIAFRRYGAEAVEPLLAAFATLPDDDEHGEARLSFGEAFSDLGENGVRDDRMFAALVGIHRLDLGLGNMYLASYGDARGAAVARASIAGAQIDFTDRTPVSNMDLFEALDAIETLGGRLTSEEAAMKARIVEFRRAGTMDGFGPRDDDCSLDEPDGEDEEPGDEGEDGDVHDGAFEFGGEPTDDDAGGGRGEADTSAGRPPWLPARGDVPGFGSRAAPHVGRNAPCPCGSGKKYKKCCGANDRGG